MYAMKIIPMEMMFETVFDYTNEKKINQDLKRNYEKKGKTLFHTYLTNKLNIKALIIFLDNIEINDENKLYIFNVNERILFDRPLIRALINLGELEVLQWLEKYESKEIDKEIYCINAIHFQKVEIFKWLIARNPQYLSTNSNFSLYASSFDDLELLNFIHDLNPDCLKNAGCCNEAVLNKNFKMLKWLIKNRYPIGFDVIIYFALSKLN